MLFLEHLAKNQVSSEFQRRWPTFRNCNTSMSIRGRLSDKHYLTPSAEPRAPLQDFQSYH